MTKKRNRKKQELSLKERLDLFEKFAQQAADGMQPCEEQRQWLKKVEGAKQAKRMERWLTNDTRVGQKHPLVDS